MGVQINGDTGNISATKADYSGNVTIGGTLTYEDVTNVDSIGLVTARNGIEVGASPGVAASISVDGNAIFSGITTIGGNVKVGTGITLSPDGDVFFTGIITGNGSGLTNLATDLVNDTSPQLGGDLDTNSHNISLDDSHYVYFGNGNDLRLLHDGNNSFIQNDTGNLVLAANRGGDVGGQIWIDAINGTRSAKFIGSGAAELYHNGTKQCETSANGLAFPSGKGIDFSAASNSASGSTSAVLDDYEEGTYNAFIMNGMDPDISSNTGAYSIQTGFYRKIGTYVEFNFFIRVTNNSAYESDGGQIRFNLPFTQDSTNYHKGHGIMSYTNINNPTPSSQAYHLYISGGQARMYSGQNEVSGGNGSGQNNRDFIGGGHFYTT